MEGRFIYGKESIPMQPWQVVDFEGCLYYAFLPTSSQTNKPETVDRIVHERSKVTQNNVDQDVKDKIHQTIKIEESFIEEEEAIFDEDDNSGENPAEDQEKLPGENPDENEEKVPGGNPDETEENEKMYEMMEKTPEMEEDESEDIIEALDEYYVIRVEDGATLSENEMYLCEECNVCFTTKESLDEHNASQHPIAVEEKLSIRFKCKICSQVFETFALLKSHVSLSHSEECEKIAKFRCNYCSYESTNKSTLQSHVSRKHSKRNRDSEKVESSSQEFSCDICEFKCQNKRRLKEHLERRHAAEYKYECEFCGKKFKVKGDMRLHVRFKHKESPIVCDVCGKTCSNSNSLYVHQKWAHFKPKFECEICKRRMVTQENLDQHILLQHERRERFVCEECGKPFQENHRLKQHMMTHTGDRPYDCHVCGKAFARRTAYRQHLLIHTGQRPYVCDICGKSFTQKPGLICHRKSHPGVHPPLPVVHIDHILNDFMKKD